MGFIYELALRISWFFLQLATLFHPKIRDFVKGRKNLPAHNLKNPIWFHCASVGEFEQARPIIEKIKLENPKEEILVTFFSPSGFNSQKNYHHADVISYSPFDTKSAVQKFIGHFNPKALILIKYEFWRNMIGVSFDRSIPIYSVSSIFRLSQRYFGSRPYKSRFTRKFFAYDLQKISFFFVQNLESKQLLVSIGISDNVLITGDTRMDRVIDIATQKKEIREIEIFQGEAPLLVLGSSWYTEEKILFKLLTKLENWKIIIAPHEIADERILQIKTLFRKTKITTLSEANPNRLEQSQILIIDNIGMLSSIYSYADLAFIGGAFRAGLHNILEAAVYGVPVIFGPKYEKFQEAVDLIELGGAVRITHEHDNLNEFEVLLSNEEIQKKKGKIAKEYVYRNEGASSVVISHLKKSEIL